MLISKSRRIIYLLTTILLSVLAIRILFIDSFVVLGDSMAPNLVNGDYVFVNKTAYWHKTPGRGDVVVGNFRNLEGKKVIKRVIGLPGEWISIDQGKVFVATERKGESKEVGRLDQEDFASQRSNNYDYRLDPYEYFLLGDNGLNSVDSRELGPIDIYSIDGKVVFKLRF